MLDRFKGFWQGVVLCPFVQLFIRLGISPDAVTLVGTLGVAAGRPDLLPAGQAADRGAGHHRLRLQRPHRRLDGAHARAGSTKFGAFWDSTLDRIGDGAIFGGLALYFAGPGDSRLYLVLCLVLPGDGRGDVLRPGQGGVPGLDAKVGIAERADRLVADPGADRSRARSSTCPS